MAGEFELISDSAEQTKRLARALSEYLRPGDFISLTGDLGAGKTCFTQGLAEGLKTDTPASSPTFTIVRVHSGRLPLYHFDLYRIDNPRQLEEIGYEEYFFGDGVSVVEWGDKMMKLFPPDHLTLEMHRAPGGDNLRKIKVISTSVRSDAIARELLSIAKKLRLRTGSVE